MNAAERIQALLFEYHLNARQFALSIGVVPQIIYDIQKGKLKNMSDDLMSKILERYSDVNKAWLYTGEGDMLLSSKPMALDSSSFKLMMAEMTAQRESSFEIIRNFQRQLDRMLTIIETKLGIEYTDQQ